MALSGSASTGFARHSLIIEWSATQSIPNNNSTVTAKVYLQSNDQYGAMYAPATNYGSVTVDGVTKSFYATSDLTAYQKKLLTTQTFTVGHNADGTRSFSFSTTYNINVTFAGVFYGNQTASGTGTLNTIPRASSITSISGGTLGSPVTVTIARASNDFTHKVWYYRPNGQYIEVGSGVGTSLTFTPSIDDCALLPNATSGTTKIEIGTYQNGTLIGGYVSKAFTVTVSASVVPYISNISITDLASLQTKFQGFVQFKSRAKASMQGNGVYGSTITQKKVTGNGQLANEFELSTDVLLTSGTNPFTFEITDSRGRKASLSQNIEVIPYNDPQIQGLSVFRCNADGTVNNEGTYVKVTYNASIAPVNNKNDKAFKLRWKTNGGTWSEQALSNASYDLAGSIVLSGFNTDNSYEMQLVATDYFVAITKPITVPSGFTLINYHNSGKGLAFGGVMERSEGVDFFLETQYKELVTFNKGIVTPNIGLQGTIPDGDANSLQYWHSFPNGHTIWWKPDWSGVNYPSDWMMVEVLKSYEEFSVIAHTQAAGAVYRKSGNYNTISDWSEFSQEKITYIYNSNGYGLRFPNGVQICWADYLTSNSTLTAGHGHLYTTNNTKWTYPASFVGKPAISFASDGGVPWTWAGLGASSPTSTSCEWIGMGAVSVNTQVQASIIAIGRWK